MGQILTAEYDFRSDEFVRSPIIDRIQKCRAMAAEAKGLAAIADSEMRDAYIDLAQHWLALADEMLRV